MVEWLRKSCLGVRMASIAERRLLRLKHLGLSFKLVGAVAARTTDQSLTVSGPLEVGVRANVAGQALLLHLFRRCLRELEDIARNPTALDMGLTGSVAAFACHALAAVFKSQLACGLYRNPSPRPYGTGCRPQHQRSLPDSPPSSGKMPRLAAAQRRHTLASFRQTSSAGQESLPDRATSHAPSPQLTRSYRLRCWLTLDQLVSSETSRSQNTTEDANRL